jgi:hypothetical protein
MLVKAWLEISLDPVQGIDQTRSTYGSEFMIIIMSTRLLSPSVISILSLTVGVSSIKVLIDFMDGILKFRIEEKAG